MANNSRTLNNEKKVYLFDFQSFIGELRDNSEKKQIVEDYEKHVLKGKKIKGDIKDQIWYKDYLSKFTPIPKYMVPEELQNDFDWDLLFQLIAGSFSSKYRLVFESSMPELFIWVQSGEIAIEKKVSELWSFQIQRLYEIYCEEFINLEVLINANEEDKNGIKKERKKSLKNFSKKVNPPAPKIEKKTQSNINKKRKDKNIVYFYCSLESAYHILKSGKIFASDLVYMNDKEELTFGINVMMEALQTIAEDKTKIYDADLKKWLNKEFLNKANEEKFKKELENDHVYIACFSYKGNVLNQWRAYGDDGFGVCIKFDFNITLNDPLSDEFWMQEVVYIDKSKIEKNQEGIREDKRKRYWNYELKYFERVFMDIKKTYEETGNVVIPLELRRHLRFYKDHSFEEENEYRQICLNESNKYTPKTRVGKGYLIPYIELELGNVNKETSVIEIITGPAVNPQKARRSFEEFFRALKADPKIEYDYSHVKIKHSMIPYLP